MLVCLSGVLAFGLAVVHPDPVATKTKADHMLAGHRVVRALRRSTLALAVLATGIAASAHAQWPAPNAAPGGLKPAAASAALGPVPADAVVAIPDLDIKSLLAQDELNLAAGQPLRYAVPHAVDIRPSTAGHWSDAVTNDGRPLRVWRLHARCANAANINLGFTEFRLPASATMFIHSPGLEHVVRGFTWRDHAEHGQLWTPPVPGNEVVIELAVDPREERAVRLRLGSVNPGYRAFGKGDVEGLLSGSCNVDVVCPEGDEWRDEIASVAVISRGGSTICTGFMVNNVRQDLTPYFMTAAHCGVTASNAASLVAFWGYEHSTCRVPGSGASGGAGDGDLSRFTTGSTWLAAHSPSDMTLVRLSSSPAPEWFVSFAGWDATPTDAQWSVAIHHPQTDEKRISFDYDPATTTTYLQNAVPGDGTHVRITQWDLGTTEPGSSGSPLFNQDHRVTGQLHGGFASCTSLTSDWYGRFSVSWNGGGTASTQLRAWLDPDATGTLVMDTLSTRGLSITPASGAVHQGVLGGPFTNDPYAYTLSNSTPNPVNWTARSRDGLGYLLNGSASPIGGTLAPGQATTVTVTCGAPIIALPAGTFSDDIIFADVGTGVERAMTHRAEVGLTSISVTPDAGLQASGPVGGPFTSIGRYTVSSTSPSPVSVSVTANAPWITIDGGTSATFTLPSLGSSREVTVAIGNAATGLPAGAYSGAVSFANTSGGSGGASRSVSLEVGRVVYAATDLPRTISDNAVATSSIVVSDDFCIGDVDVQIGLTHTYIGDLEVDLISPDGVVVRLHNRTGGSTDDIRTTYDDDGAGTLPSGPGTLSSFDAARSVGTWTLRVADRASGDIGSIQEWSLRMVPVGGACPTLQVVHSEPLDEDPGWSVQGQWAFGTPTGSGTTDPTSGFTGSNVYGYNLAGNYANNMSAMQLVSTPFDCSDVTGTRVAFRRWLGVESSQYDKAVFSVSTDGSTWTTVWQHSGATINETAWSYQSYDISAIADGQPAVYLRWTMGTTDSSVVFSGWNIDDVQILGFVDTPTCAADMNGDGAVNGIDMGLMLGRWGECAGCSEDLDGDGLVNGVDMGVMLGSWGECP